MTYERLARLVAFLAFAIPCGLGYWVADRVADLLCLLYRPLWRAIGDNQRHIPPAGTARALRARTRRACHHWARGYFDLFRLARLSDASLAACTEVEGEAYLAEALQGGRGAILITLHLGTPEVLGRVLASRGYQGCVVVERTRPALLFNLMSTLRTHAGLELVPIDRALIRLVRTLRQGKIVALMADRDLTESGIPLPFFGQVARLPTGAARLSQRTGAPIVIGVCFRLPAGRFRVVLEPPLLPPQEQERAGAVEQTVAAMAARLEALIRQAPEQWTVTTPLWP